jgi:hypothetical protein
MNSGCCQLGAVETDQNSLGGGLLGAGGGILDEHWVPGSASAIPVQRFAANSCSDSVLFSKNHGHM